jgi:hypothetical protein
MSETHSGLTRLAALFLLSAAFSWTWAGDRQVQAEYVLARKEAAANLRRLQFATGEMDERPIPAAATRQTQVTIKSPIGGSGLSTGCIGRVEVEMVLPRGITPGRYRTVDSLGNVQMIRIFEVPGPVELRDLYSVEDSEGIRQYFIRLEDGLVERSRQAIPNRHPRRR